VKRHPVDVFSLVFGVVFAVLGGTYLVSRVDYSKLHLEWLWPIPLIAIGLLIIAMAAGGGSNGEES